MLTPTAACARQSGANCGSVATDGNCFFASVAALLTRLGAPESAAALRHRAVAWLEDHADSLSAWAAAIPDGGIVHGPQGERASLHGTAMAARFASYTR